MNNFIKTYSNTKYEILTDNGWEDFSGLGKTDKLDIIEIKTEKGLILKGSPDHRVFDENKNEIHLKDIKVDDNIFTNSNIQKIVSKEKHIVKENLYDILDVENSKYFTNDILSHNCGKSTSFEIFLCWTILFQKDQRVAILANKAEQARDILRKVKEAYEMLPKWLQQGVKVWNAGSIKLENGSMVIAASTSSTAIRGRSINCITGKNKIKVKDKETNEIKEITLDELYKDFK